jgi:signal transduction histidine kinase
VVQIDTRMGQAKLRVANAGPPVPASEIDRLLQPFQRLNGNRVSESDGFGLGLSIVTAIATAHGAVFTVQPGGVWISKSPSLSSRPIRAVSIATRDCAH